MVRIDSVTIGRGLILTGLVHLLAPESLLDVARYAYGRTLDVGLSPGDRSERRIRAVGLFMLAAGTVASSADRSVSVAAERT